MIRRWKILMVAVSMIFALSGCSAISGFFKDVPEAENILGLAADVALYKILENNPDYAAPTVEILKGIKEFSAGEVSYNDLLLYASDEFGADEDLAAIALIVGDGLFSEEPIINSIGIFDGYRDELTARIDRLLFVAEMVKE